ncbi:MAG: glycoside hydrolase family 2 TIM barrel-domain containing protein [Agathobacter sp.]
MQCVELNGDWELCLDKEKQCVFPPVAQDTIVLPDSTAHAQKGVEDCTPNVGYMTDRFYFEGYAWYSRQIEVEEEWEEKSMQLFLERTRVSTVYIDGVELDTQNSLCGYHIHDLTGSLKAGAHRLTVRVDNTNYPTRGGHMTSPDTQTNWNGIVGRIELQIREKTYPYNLQVAATTPDAIQITAEIFGCDEGTALVEISKKEGEILYQAEHTYQDGRIQVNVGVQGEDLLWDEYHPNLLCAKVTVQKENVSSIFGIRKLSCEGRRLLVNGREVFWRGKHDGLVFPSTGYSPMTVEEWKKVFATAKEYGINHYRFHTCCPPDAAFSAADEMGIYMEPELPFWGTIAAPGEEYYNETEQEYLIEEGFRILRDFGNHPSFVMLSMGNELWGNQDRINSFLHNFKEADSRHLYTQGSNNFQFCPAVLEDEDVFCGVRLSGDRLFRGSYAMCDAPQGHIQTMHPNSSHNYDEIIAPHAVQSNNLDSGEIEIQYGTGVKKVKAVENAGALIPEVPVISHEIGQYDFFPDFTELGRYEGSQQPLYLNVYRERMEKSDVYHQWKEFFRATGTFAIDCYRREIETALRTKELSGFQLLDLQDFPGQNVALVGVLNAWMESKGLITPVKWRQFCSDTVILAELESFVVTERQQVSMPIRLSVCNWESFAGKDVAYRIQTDENVLCEGTLPILHGTSRLADVGVVEFEIPKLTEGVKITVQFWIPKTDYSNEYTLWAYPDYEIEITEEHILYGEKEVLLAHSPDEVEAYKKSNREVIYIPEATENDVEGTYCTDFWNYPMFRSISESMNRKIPVGTLGLYIQKSAMEKMHFPCENYSTPQWYRLVMHSHCKVLDGCENVDILVQPIDNVERCHKLGMLYIKDGVIACTSRLWEVANFPEVRAFARGLIEMTYK